MRIEGTLAVGGVGGGLLLWTQAAHFGGYGFAAAAFLSLGGVQSRSPRPAELQPLAPGRGR